MQEVEVMMRDYHNLKKQLSILQFQLEHFQGIRKNDLIEALCFSHPEGERVSCSNISDKTAKVALNYDAIQNEMEDDIYQFYYKEYQTLEEKISFFEYALLQLSGELSGIMMDFIIKKYSWDEVIDKYHTSRAMVSRYRKKAVEELKWIYEVRDKKQMEYMLS